MAVFLVLIGTIMGEEWDNGVMWLKQCHLHHPLVITIFIGINHPKMGWFMTLFQRHKNHGIMDLPWTILRWHSGGNPQPSWWSNRHCWVYRRYYRHDSGSDKSWRYRFHKAYFSGLREYPHKIWPYMVLTYLQFRILEISHWIYRTSFAGVINQHI